MFALRSIVALLLVCVAVSVIAHPVPMGVQRRHVRARAAQGAVQSAAPARRCKPRTSASEAVSSTLVTSATASTLPAETTQQTTSTHEATTSTHTSTSTQAASTSHSASHTTSHSSATPSPTQDSSSDPAPHNQAFAALAPISPVQSWSTSPSAPNPLPLEDSTLQVTHLLSALAHPYVKAPDGQLSMKATYPQGSYNFQHEPLGGLSFYANGPDNVDLTTAKEVTFGYTVYFDEGFEFNIGGKLPGVYGGNSAEEAVSCSGGRRDDGCFSSRLMWRTDGKGELYTYLPPSFDANNKVCDVAPQSECNPTYGASVGRGAFYFKAGQSNAVTMRVRLNDVGKENGELELWANGQSVISVDGLVLRDSSAGRIQGLQMQTFFGGSTPNFASPKTQHSYFRDFTVAITEKL